MEKTYLKNFIRKYSLDGATAAVRWKITGNAVKVLFKTQDRSVLGMIDMNVELPDCEIGIADSKSLISLLGALNEDLSISYHYDRGKLTGLSVSDEHSKAIYMLTDLSVVDEVQGLKKTPDWDVQVDLKKDFVDRLIKSCASVSGAKILGLFPISDIGSGNTQVEFIVNYAQHNTTRLTMKTDAEVVGDISTSSVSAYDLVMFSKVLEANRGDFMKSKLMISEQGIICLEFTGEDYEAQYYMQRIKM